MGFMPKRVKPPVVEATASEAMDAALSGATPPVRPVALRAEDLLHSGSTLLNLAITDRPEGAFLPGYFYLFVGESRAGKTFLSMTNFAETTLNPRYQNHELIFDNAERGNLMDLDKIFNERVAERLRPPRTNAAGEPVYSRTIEEFYYNMDDAIERGKPFIYVLDSMDVLGSEGEDKKFVSKKKAFRKAQARADGEATESGKEEDKTVGSMGMEKAKANSLGMRRVMAGLEATGSFLIVLSQIRSNPASMYGGKTRGGGYALRFYNTVEVWFSIVGAIKKEVHGTDRKVGSRVLAEVQKNRITGKLRDVTLAFYPSFGLDDTGSCVDFLCDEQWWAKAKNGMIDAADLGLKGTKETIIRHIEQRGLEPKLHTACGKCWAELEAAMALKRKNKYQ